MAELDQGDRTEEATQQRREDFRKKGQVVQTRELSSVFVLFMSVIAIWMLGRFFLEQIHSVFTKSFDTYLTLSARDGDWLAAIKFSALKGALIVTPIFGIMWLMSFASSTLQIGFLVNEEAMKFNPNRINPAEGFKRVFSLRSVFEGIKATFKVIIVGSIVALILKSEVIVVPQLVNYTISQMFMYVGDVFFKLFAGVGFFMAILAGLDYLYQRWEMEKKMRMTKQEVKDELKSREGDPLIRARIRHVQRDIANKRMMESVPKADVIITNPTHIAVALQYNEETVAPKVLAKGAGLIAEKIKEIAQKNNVPIVENKPLARTIFKTLNIGQIIPRELYTAVAEVLSYVYKLKKKVLN